MVYSPYQSDAVKTLGTVYVVDDDEAVRDSIRWLLEASDYRVELYDSGESFIPYLEEMESMGLTVHFRLPLLDRIEEACCDETSAARLSRTLGRCAGGSIVTMGTVELKLAGETIGMVNLIAGQDVSQSSLLYSLSKLREFFGSLYLKVVLCVSALCAIVYVAWLFLNAQHDRRPSKKIHRYGRPHD